MQFIIASGKRLLLCAALLCLNALASPAHGQKPEDNPATQSTGDVLRVSTELVQKLKSGHALHFCAQRARRQAGNQVRIP